MNHTLEILATVENIIKEELSSIDSIILLFESLPFPCWLKSIDGKILAVNREYKKHYETSDNEDGTISLKFKDIILSEYRANDEWVSRFERGRAFIETCPRKNDATRKAMVIKFPVYNMADQVCGIGGIELTEAEMEI